MTAAPLYLCPPHSSALPLMSFTNHALKYNLNKQTKKAKTNTKAFNECLHRGLRTCLTCTHRSLKLITQLMKMYHAYNENMNFLQYYKAFSSLITLPLYRKRNNLMDKIKPGNKHIKSCDS